MITRSLPASESEQMDHAPLVTDDELAWSPLDQSTAISVRPKPLSGSSLARAIDSWRENRIDRAEESMSSNNLSVFISSRTDELATERNATRSSINGIAITTAWLFEESPATSNSADLECIDRVDECEIFILLLQTSLTFHVKAEYDRALETEKRILVYLAREASRTPELEKFLQRLERRHKIGTYSSVDELADSVREAIQLEVLRSFRSVTAPQTRVDIVNDRKNILLQNYVDVEAAPLDRNSPRLPVEFIKDADDDHADILSVLAESARLSTIPQQLHLARSRNFADLYTGSEAQAESHLITLYVLRHLVRNGNVSSSAGDISVLDAGCADGGLVSVLRCLEREETQRRFSYHGQDNNPDWRSLFIGDPSNFDLLDLPEVHKQQADIVCCVNTLHLFSRNPLLIAATMMNFNAALRTSGLCVLIAPEKDAQPGMLEVLEEVARRANFSVQRAERVRLSHRLYSQSARNTTTYVALIGRKSGEINREQLAKLTGASLYRADLPEKAAKYRVALEGDIAREVRVLESGLQDLLDDELAHVRFLRYALQTVHERLSSGQEHSPSQIAVKIKLLNQRVSGLCVGGRSPATERAAAEYLVELLLWYTTYLSGVSPDELIERVLTYFRRAFRRTNPDSRIKIDDLTVDHVAKLVRNLCEVCYQLGIDLRRAFDDFVEN